MDAEIISIGDELLIGQVVNTNAAWMGEKLSLNGIRTSFVSTVGDNRDHILKSISNAAERARIILLTGGLGPTKDDITKSVLCEYFKTDLRYDEEVLANVTRLFKLRGRSLTELNRRQAEVPANCQVINNEMGTAPGMWFEFNGCILISMPGVPYEMKAMMQNSILPELSKRFGEGVIIHKTLHTVGIPESFLAAKLEEFEEDLPENISLAYLPEPGMVRLRLSAFGHNRKALTELMEEKLKTLVNLAAKYIFSESGESLEEAVGKLLLVSNSTLSVAESCSGGYLGSLITGIPGSSAYFMGGIISYSNQVKMQWLGVNGENLEQYGAVSEAVVVEMAANAREKFGTTYALSISGIAGPGGGSNEKPVGTVWIGISGPKGTKAEKFSFGEDRKLNVRLAAVTALNLLRHEIMPYVTKS
jgi:nicotinamide-nucleotide amidase